MTSEREDRWVRVWDPFVRLFHWSLVLSFAVAWLSAHSWDDLHMLAGFAAGGLILLRLVWGFIGTPYARFTPFRALAEDRHRLSQGRRHRQRGPPHRS